MNLLWALVAGLQKRHWTDLSKAEKDQIRGQLEQLTRYGRKSP